MVISLGLMFNTKIKKIWAQKIYLTGKLDFFTTFILTLETKLAYNSPFMLVSH